jgi:SAM-dependent methyltransferase
MTAHSPAQRLFRRLRHGDARGVWLALLDRVAPPRPKMARAVHGATAGARGLEIGGPSRVFGPRGMLPVYPHAERIDNVNFATDTAWEEKLRDGGPFHFHLTRPPGTQWLREATSLSGVPDAAVDFVLSSHCLEHVADPLRALHEWRRVTKPGGHLVLVLPDPQRTFDHQRPITTLAHLRSDFARGIAEDDATHFAEILALHDVTRDPGVGSAEEFGARAADNARNRCLHHHVFDLALMSAALAEAGWNVLATERVRPLHLVALAQKAAA